MKIRIRWAFAGAFIALVLIINSFAGFAGFFSFLVSLFLPFYAVSSIIYIFFSWNSYAWFQSFSTNHPRKGETIHFDIRFSNDGILPLLGGTCTFIMPDSSKTFALPIGHLPSAPNVITYTADIACPYRGTYIAGIESINLSTPLGIIKTSMNVHPETFYVFPELCPLTFFNETYTPKAGTNISPNTAGEEDSSVFECTAPLTDGVARGRIAWKKWASSGVPATIVSGQSRSKEVTVVLDLYPCTDATKNERLACEDMVISAAFSLLNHLAKRKIPVTFITGGEANGILIENPESFTKLYERSVNIFFNDPSFPESAFNGQSASFLFTARPLSELYNRYEKAMQTGGEPHLFLCPTESRYQKEKERAGVVEEQRHTKGCRSLFYTANVINGSKEITDAFTV